MVLETHKNMNFVEIGVDEAGRGPMFGRVYAAAVIWNPEIKYSLIRDSKKLSQKRLQEAYDFIIKHAISYGVAYSSEQEVDDVNILNATLDAMHLAISSCQLIPDLLLIDGNRFNPYSTTINEDENMIIPYETVVGGDDKYMSIACASILAKVSRDNYIHELCDQYPELEEKYDLRKNKGYGTKKHREGIEKYGLHKFHRRSFNKKFNIDKCYL